MVVKVAWTWSSEIYDPIHQVIPVASWEQLVLNSWSMRRLQRTFQTSYNFLALPGATHTRYAHSVGAMHLAWRIYESVIGIPVSKETIKHAICLRLAALLHDVGHGPLSHASETLMAKLGVIKERFHEDAARKIILDEMNSIWPQVAKEIEDETKEEDKPGHKYAPEELTGEILKILFDHSHFLHQLVSGDIDVDRLDYLRRDAFHTNISFTGFDTDLLITHLKYSTADGFYLESFDGIKAAEAMLIARDQNFSIINFNPINRLSTAIAERILHLGLSTQRFPELFEGRKAFLRRVAASPEQATPAALDLDAIWEFARKDDTDQWNAVEEIVQSNGAAKYFFEFFFKQPDRTYFVYAKDLHLDLREWLGGASHWEIAFLETIMEKQLLEKAKPGASADDRSLIVDMMPYPAEPKYHRFRIRHNPEVVIGKAQPLEDIDAIPTVKALRENERLAWRICIYALDIGGVDINKLKDEIKHLFIDSPLFRRDNKHDFYLLIKQLASEELMSLEQQ
jgi:HD superfamily phosphohydrolase